MMAEQFAAAGVDNTRVPAVYTDELGRMRAAGLDLSAFNLVDTLTVNVALRDGWLCCESEKSAARTAAARSMYRPSELGAALSHIKAIATAAQSGAEFAVISEDDISLATVPRWDHSLSDIVAMAPPGWRMLRLHTLYTNAGSSAHDTLCAQRRPFLPWDLTQKSAAAYVVSRDGMQKLLNESGWPDVRRLSAFLTRAITAPLELGALAGGWGTAGKAAPDDLIPRTMYPGTYTFTRPLFLTSAVRSGIQTADMQEAGEEPANRVVAAHFRCGGRWPSEVKCAPLRLDGNVDFYEETRCYGGKERVVGVKGTHGIPACCAASCMACGGKGCQNRPGGEEQCCGLAIRRSQRLCETHPPPCTPYRFGPKVLS